MIKLHSNTLYFAQWCHNHTTYKQHIAVDPSHADIWSQTLGIIYFWWCFSQRFTWNFYEATHLRDVTHWSLHDNFHVFNFHINSSLSKELILMHASSLILLINLGLIGSIWLKLLWSKLLHVHMVYIMLNHIFSASCSVIMLHIIHTTP